jgi:hypothetical protein
VLDGRYIDQSCYDFSGSGDSLPGRLGGVQYVHLYRDAAKADIMQLIMYLLGFFNEFRRPDRDSQVVVHYDNIAPGETFLIEINSYTKKKKNQREKEKISFATVKQRSCYNRLHLLR